MIFKSILLLFEQQI